ncbi:hypothetical protein GH714_042394 [Hevea brasiliensis]|uniref:DDE Tnp4 domain-containing protein n=1 Tax=Hevea brasiliensis TaxID=3981 RepID=A0A6A6LQA2_HEVBR|nr:hypothetical protein GH714_042394 [Hevea brasiliensis]
MIGGNGLRSIRWNIYEGWEGLAADGRILRDALNRRYSLKVPPGYYYLVDAGYINCEGFLAPYRGQRYHLNEWRDGRHPEKGSGFGWDDKQKMVTGDRTEFDESVKSHKDAKGLFWKPFAFYDIFEEIYAKDRATGVSAADRVDAKNNQSTNCISESNPADDDASGQFIGTSQDPPSGSKK